jgi:steroid 5-alpha reductase family enzyme
MNSILLAFLISVGLNIVMFFPAFILRTDKLTDISYALTFALVTIFLLVLGDITMHKIIIAVCIIIWAIRLGTYLLIRISRMKKDSRFDNFRHKFFPFLGFWVLQGITVFIVLLPSIFFFRISSPQVYFIGILIWATGLIIETVADYQKYTFIQNKKNKGKWIDSGLWHYSRHPNYFGEILCWLGIWIAVLPSLPLWQQIAGALSPLFISIMLLFISGIPLLEKQGNERWGKDPNYQQYLRNTSSLILWPSKKENKKKKK